MFYEDILTVSIDREGLFKHECYDKYIIFWEVDMISIIMILAYVASAINMIVIFSYFAERK